MTKYLFLPFSVHPGGRRPVYKGIPDIKCPSLGILGNDMPKRVFFWG